MADGGISEGLLIGGGSLLGGGIGALGAKSAAGTAADASRQAAQLAQAQYQQTRSDLLPYNQAGQSVLPSLTSLATSGPYGGGPNYVSQAAGIGVGPQGQAALEQTPGYQFQLQQGLKSTQASAAARGLGVSGAALKGAAQYATGLASSNYQQQFQNALALNTAQQGNLQNQYSRLAGVAGIGANAAEAIGTAGTSLAGTAAQAATGAGQAQAAGTLGMSNALTGGINNYLGYKALQNLTGQTGGYQNVLNTPSMNAGMIQTRNPTWTTTPS